MSALRIGAALWIVGFHLALAGLLDGVRLPALLLVALRNGAPMTGFFIMMSGFMMYYAYTRPDGTLSATPRYIWTGRIARLWPIMMVGHLLAVPFAFLGEDRYAPLEAIGRGVAVMTALQGWFPKWAFSYNTPAWTLSVLAFCYALLPSIVRGLRARTPNQLIAMLWACWLAMLVPTLAHFLSLPTGLTAASDARDSAAEQLLHAFPPVRLAEFVMGAVLGRLFLHRGTRRSPALFALGTMSGVAVLVYLSTEPTLPSRFVANGLLAPLYWPLLLGVACAPAAVERLVARARLVDLGEASLSVFVLHMPFVLGLRALHVRGLLPEAVHGPMLAAFVVGIVFVSCALETGFVRPAAAWVKARLDGWMGAGIPNRPAVLRLTPREPFTGPSAVRRVPRSAQQSTAA